MSASDLEAPALPTVPPENSPLPWEKIETWLHKTFRFNPAVTVLELRTRLRERRAYGQLFLSGLGTSATALIAYSLMREHNLYSNSDPVGGKVFLSMVMAQLTIILLIIPGYAAATLAMERETRTLELVQASLLTPADVVTGKLLAVFAYAAMLLFASLPVAAWCLTLGGLDVLDVLLSYSYLTVVCLGAISLGLLVGAFQTRTAAAFATATGILLIALIGMPTVIMSLASQINGFMGGDEGTVLMECGMLLLCGSALGWWLYVMIARNLDPTAKSLAQASIKARLFAALGAIPICSIIVYMVGRGALGGSKEELFALFAILHPYSALLGILQAEAVHHMLPSLRGNSNWSGPLIWAVATFISLIAGLMLWYMAVMAFRLSWRKELRQAARE